MRNARVWKRAAAATLLTAAVALLGAATPASAAQSTMLAGPYAAMTGFATPQVVVFQGDGLTFTNTDVSSHRVTATTFGPAGPLFESAFARVGQSVPVDGVESLAPGTYTFVCTLHTNMTGTITVLAR